MNTQNNAAGYLTDKDVPSSTSLWVTVDLVAIAHNYTVLQDYVGPRCIVAPVLKADAYGLGAQPIARHLAAQGARHFFIATPAEALGMRQYVPADATIYALNGLWKESAPALAQARITPVLSTRQQVDWWQKTGQRLKQRLPFWLQIETGMHRLGLSATQTQKLLGTLASSQGTDLQLTGMMSHLSSSYQIDHPANAQQQQTFETLTQNTTAPTIRSLANSGGIALGADYHYDLVRPGLALYGIYTTRIQGDQAWTQKLRNPLTVQARILQITQVPKGAAVGYDQTFITKAPTRIATVSYGYADGYFCALSNKGTAHIAGHSVPVLGRVSMDLITLDVTQVPNDVLENISWVTMIDDTVTPASLAAMAGTHPWELLSHLGKRAFFQYET